MAIPDNDFNGDGKLDWAVSNGGDNSIWIYIGKGDDTWCLFGNRCSLASNRKKN